MQLVTILMTLGFSRMVHHHTLVLMFEITLMKFSKAGGLEEGAQLSGSKISRFIAFRLFLLGTSEKHCLQDKTW